MFCILMMCLNAYGVYTFKMRIFEVSLKVFWNNLFRIR